MVRPATMIRWQRAGWKLSPRLKSLPGPQIPMELRALIRRMANEYPTWGQERIANELILKLGIQVSPRTVRKYLPARPPGRPRRGLAMVGVSAPARPEDHCLRFLGCRHRHIPIVVHVRGDRAPQPAPDPLQPHSASECCLDASTAAQGRWVRAAV